MIWGAIMFDEIARFDPYELAESITAQAAELDRIRQAAELEAPALLAVVSNIALSAGRALENARELLDSNSDKETALFAIACAAGACTLISGLVEKPDDPYLRHMARPFVGGEK